MERDLGPTAQGESLCDGMMESLATAITNALRSEFQRPELSTLVEWDSVAFEYTEWAEHLAERMASELMLCVKTRQFV